MSYTNDLDLLDIEDMLAEAVMEVIFESITVIFSDSDVNFIFTIKTLSNKFSINSSIPRRLLNKSNRHICILRLKEAVTKLSYLQGKPITVDVRTLRSKLPDLKK